MVSEQVEVQNVAKTWGQIRPVHYGRAREMPRVLVLLATWATNKGPEVGRDTQQHPFSGGTPRGGSGNQRAKRMPFLEGRRIGQRGECPFRSSHIYSSCLQLPFPRCGMSKLRMCLCKIWGREKKLFLPNTVSNSQGVLS